MNKVFTAVIGILFCVQPVLGAESDTGTAGAAFLKLGAGARPAAMGDAFTAVADDSTAVYWNPAGLNRVSGRGSLAFMHAIWFEGISYNWISYALPVANSSAIGIGAQYLSYGDLTRTDATGLETGSFSPNDTAVSLSYARKISGYSAGATLKYISSKIVNTATAYAADLGITKELDRLALGAVVQNAGTKLKYVSDEEKLPMNMKIGVAYRVNNNWLAAMDINAPADGELYYGIGAEYMRSIGNKTSVFGRAGYNTRNKDTGGFNGVTAGLGLKYLDYSIDYAFVPYGDLGDTNRISLSVKY